MAWSTNRKRLYRFSFPVLCRNGIQDEHKSGVENEDEDAAISPQIQVQQERSPFLSQISTQHISSDISSEERNTQAYDHSPLKWRRPDDVLAQCNLCIIEPEKYAEAAQDSSWLKAMVDELQMILKNGTWELVDRPTEKSSGFTKPS